ncbi:phosphotransferase enzyme family protein [Streptomyces scopuliridis]|uniref:phosphotransferase enzyme family protein n=1 Tax=Streptomyces scopuliridis TaxID=452529 RepID=UPI0034208BC5
MGRNEPVSDAAVPAAAKEPGVGERSWAASLLASHWNLAGEHVALAPLVPAGGERPLSHVSGLWRVDIATPLPGLGPALVLKTQLNPEAARPISFHLVKRQVLEHCRERGLPVPIPVPSVGGSPVVRYEGLLAELIPLLPGTARPIMTSRQAAEVIRAGLALRATLDVLPGHLTAPLAGLPVPRLVAEENWRFALDDALTRLLPMAERRTDRWGSAVARSLHELSAAQLLLTSVPEASAEPPAVIHADLHRHHLLFEGEDMPRLTGILDFDNLELGDRLLDLAWIAEAAARVAGGETERRRSLSAFIGRAEATSLLRPTDTGRLMPVLLAYAIPVIVDIAKDVLERDLLEDIWFEYLDLLSPGRMVGVHAHLLSLSSPSTAVQRHDRPQRRTEPS